MPDHDPTEVNSLEEALRRMRPTPIDPAPLLFAAGRESTSRSLRRWRWLAGAATMVAATLLGSQILRVSATPEVKVVHLIPAFASVEAPVEDYVPEEPTPRRDMVWQAMHFGMTAMPLADDDDDDDDFVPPPPLRAGDAGRVAFR